MMKHCLSVLTVLGLAAACQAAPAEAAASPWVKKLGAKLRLIGGVMPATAVGPARLVAGLEIELEPEWKTYWRSPGDGGGVPPSIEWQARSTNVAKADVLYPAPQRFADGGGDSIGYHDRVVFPLIVTAVDPAQPVTLATDVFIGVCKDICVPVEMAFDLALAPNQPAEADEAAVLSQALAAVPMTGPPRPGAVAAVTQVSLDAKTSALSVDVAVANGAATVSLFATADDGTYVPLPGPATPIEGSALRFVIDLSQAGKHAVWPGKTLRLTIVSKSGAVETTTTLPNAAK